MPQLAPRSSWKNDRTALATSMRWLQDVGDRHQRCSGFSVVDGRVHRTDLQSEFIPHGIRSHRD